MMELCRISLEFNGFRNKAEPDLCLSDEVNYRDCVKSTRGRRKEGVDSLQ